MSDEASVLASEVRRLNRLVESMMERLSEMPEQRGEAFDLAVSVLADGSTQDLRLSRPALDIGVPVLLSFARGDMAERQLRLKFLPAEAIDGPGWNILIDLFGARLSNKSVAITAACMTSGVPATTALRWIGLLEEWKLIVRAPDPTDRRRVWLAISDKTFLALARYFDAVRELREQVHRMPRGLG